VAVAAAVLVHREVVQGPLAATAPVRVLLVSAVVTLAAACALCCLVDTGPGGRRAAALCAGLLGCLLGWSLLGWQAGAAPVRAAGGLGATLLPAVLLHVAARPAPRRWRLVPLAYLTLGGCAIAVVLVREPLYDTSCWADCSLTGVAVLPSAEWTNRLVSLEQALQVLVAAGCTALTAWVWRHEQPGTSAVLTTAAAGAAATFTALLPSVIDRAGPFSATGAAVTGLALLAVAAVAVGLCWPSAAAVRRRRALRQLAERLGSVPPLGSLETQLAQVLDDPALRVAFWLPDQARFVDASGQPASEDGSGPVVHLRRDGALLARVTLGRELDPDSLEQQLGAAARLAVDNERLQAERLAHLHALQESRTRIVQTGDDSRRQVERDVHDVVQAELLGAMLELAGAASTAARVGDAPAEGAARELAEGVARIVAAVRQVSHGVYPAVLDTVGLSGSLEALRDEAPVPLRVDVTVDRLPDREAERAAYLLVADAVDAAQPGGPPMTVSVQLRKGLLAVVLEGYPRAELPVHLGDRVGARGGSARVRRSRLEAVLPCG
jgi:signal transduction histidine kinase